MNTLRFNAVAAALAACFSLSATVTLAASGDLDPTFGTGGFVMTAVQDLSSANDVIVDAKHRVLAAGSGSNAALSTMSPALIRYLPDGSLDTSFGDSGSGIEMVAPPAGLGEYAEFCCVRLDSKNRIVAAGFTEIAAPAGAQKVLTVLRLSEDGTLDPSFGENGFVANVIAAGEAYSAAQALTIDASDRIVIGGATFDTTFLGTPLLVRYNTNGTLDHSFGDGGIATLPETGFSPAPVGMRIDGDGRIVVAGNYIDLGSATQGMYVARYQSNGEPDASFGTDGIVHLEGTPGNAFTLDPMDRPIVASYEIDGVNAGMERLNTDGTLDTGFGPDGTGIVTATVDDGAIWPASIAIDGAGNVVLAATYSVEFEPSTFAALRYTGDGEPDMTFGTDGMSAPAGPGDGNAESVTVDSSGAITLTGYTVDADTGDTEFTTIRLQN